MTPNPTHVGVVIIVGRCTMVSARSCRWIQTVGTVGLHSFHVVIRRNVLGFERVCRAGVRNGTQKVGVERRLMNML